MVFSVVVNADPSIIKPCTPFITSLWMDAWCDRYIFLKMVVKYFWFYMFIKNLAVISVRGGSYVPSLGLTFMTSSIKRTIWWHPPTPLTSPSLPHPPSLPPPPPASSHQSMCTILWAGPLPLSPWYGALPLEFISTFSPRNHPIALL